MRPLFIYRALLRLGRLAGPVVHRVVAARGAPRYEGRKSTESERAWRAGACRRGQIPESRRLRRAIMSTAWDARISGAR